MSTQHSDGAQSNSSRLVHSSLGGPTPFWRGLTFQELGLFATPLLIGFIGMSALPQSIPRTPMFALVLSLELILLGSLRAKPDYYRLTEFLLVRLLWGVQDDHYGSGDSESDVAAAPRLSGINETAVERLGDQYVGAVEVTPANMALKDRDAWSDAVASLTNFVSSTLEYRAKIYVTSREVDDSEYIESHQDRLSDPDVRRNPVLENLIEEFVDDHTDGEGNVDRDLPPERRFYVVTWITDSDIIETHEDDESIVRGLSMIPLVGRLFERFRGNDLTEEEIAENKRRKVEDRLEEIRHGVANLRRCRPRTVEPPELARLVREYWTCDTEDIDMTEPMTSPLVGGSRTAEGVGPAVVEDGSDEATDDGGASDAIDRRQRHQRRAVAPSDIDWEKDYAVIDDEKYARTFWIEAFPERPNDGFLHRLVLDTDLRADISIHLNPYESQSAVDLISDWIASLEATKRDATELKQEDIEQEIAQAKHIRDMVRRNETSLVRTGVFIRLTADSEDELRRRSNRLQSLLRDAPANCIVKKVVRRTEEGLATVSPIGRNELGTDRLSTMTADAVGATFPFASNYMRMTTGIEYGTHTDNESEILIDPWDLETGHSELVTGMPGAGKSHASQARGLRSIKRRPDTLQVIIDPVGGMRGTAEALNAKYVTVSGKTPLNPCEMQPTPEGLLEKSRDMQPVAAKKDEVYGVVENFLATRDIDLEMHSGVVTHVIDTIYARSDIEPGDPSTHTPANSPTMQDFLDVLDELTEHPERFDFTSEAVRKRVVQYASELSVAMQPFREGSTYANLSKRSDMEIVTDDQKVVYLNLQQVEGSGDGMGKQSFIMQLLLSSIYQQSKRTHRNVEVIIDEAHYLFDDTANLAFLNQIARHQRHAGIRLVMLTQTLQEFYDDGAAEEIASMCPIKVHHREPGLDDETADIADLTDAQQRFVQSAEAGKQDTGYSQALVRVDEHGDYPLRITTSAAEKTVIEYDEDSRGELDAILDESEPEHIQELKDLVESESVQSVLTERHDVAPQVARTLVETGLTEAELVAGVVTAVDGKLRNSEQTREALAAARASIQRDADQEQTTRPFADSEWIVAGESGDDALDWSPSTAASTDVADTTADTDGDDAGSGETPPDGDEGSAAAVDHDETADYTVGANGESPSDDDRNVRDRLRKRIRERAGEE